MARRKYKKLLIQKLLAEHEHMYEQDKIRFDKEVQKKLFNSIETDNYQQFGARTQTSGANSE